MAKILDMPKLSPTMEEGQLAKWHRREGDAVNVDDLLAEVETDKATMEFRSFDKGTILKVLVAEGATVILGQPVAILGEPGEPIADLLARVGAGPAKGAPAPAAAPAAASAASAAALVATPATEPEPPPADGRVKASPMVRKLAREQGFDLARVRGTGPHGRIIARDLASTTSAPGAPLAPPVAAPKASSPSPAATTAPGTFAAPVSHPLSMMRKVIARRLTESKQNVPHFYLSVDLDADALVALRESINADLAAVPASESTVPLKVSLNDLVVRACAITLRRVPACNAQYTPEAILMHQRVDISVAVAVEDGLVTPVVRDADRKSVLQISTEIRELAGRAKQKKLRPEEMSNGTFSISNLGMFGVDHFAAVINPPEGAILAVGQVRREPVVRGDEIVIGHKLGCTLSCDHRVVDGAVGASFLRELRNLIEHPTRILL